MRNHIAVYTPLSLMRGGRCTKPILVYSMKVRLGCVGMWGYSNVRRSIKWIRPDLSIAEFHLTHGGVGIGIAKLLSSPTPIVVHGIWPKGSHTRRVLLIWMQSKVVKV
jgi:hypothetical protein